jgi:hypothetical protein
MHVLSAIQRATQRAYSMRASGAAAGPKPSSASSRAACYWTTFQRGDLGAQLEQASSP